MSRKLIITLTLIFVVFAGLFVYFHFYFFPHKFRGLLLEHAQQVLKRKITLGEASFNLLSGIRISQLTVFEKNSNDVPFFHADEVRFGILFAPLLQEKKVVIPSLSMKHPQVRLIREDEKRWNFSDLLSARPAGESPNKNFDILLGSVQITEGKAFILEEAPNDRSAGEPFSFSIDDINLHTDFSVSQGIQTELTSRIPRFGTTVSLKGNYTLASRRLQAHIDVENLPFDPVFHYLPPVAFTAAGRLRSAAFELQWENNSLSGSGGFGIERLQLQMANGKTLEGDFQTATTRFSWDGKVFRLKTDLAGPATAYTWRPQRSIKGGLQVAELTLQYSDGKLGLSTDAQLRGGQLQIGPEFISTGDLSTKQATLSLENETLQIGGDVALSAFQLSSGKDIQLSGNFQIPVLGLRDTAESTVISGDIIAQGAHYEGGGFNVNGDALASETTVSVLRPGLAANNSGSFPGSGGTKPKVEAKTNLGLANAQVTLNDKTLSGSPQIALRLNYDPDQEKRFQFEGTVACRKENLSGIQPLGELTAINGDIRFKNDELSGEEIGFTSPAGAFVLSGKLTNFADPSLRVRLTSVDINFAELQNYFSGFMAGAGLSVEGHGALAFDYLGQLRAPTMASVAGTMDIAESTLRHRDLPQPITGISGKVQYTQDYIAWKDVHGRYQDEDYTFDGSIENFSRPVVNAALRSQRTDLKGQFNILNDALQIVSLKGRLLNSQMDLRGDLHWLQRSITNFDVRGTMELDLADIPTLSPAMAETWKKFEPSGTLQLEGLFQGTPQDWRNWNLYLKGTAPELSLQGYRLKNANVNLEIRDQNVSRGDLAGTFYDGEFSLKSSADLTTPDVPFQIKLDLTNVELGRLKKDSPLKDQDLSGVFNGSLGVHGELTKWKDMEGNGSMSVTDGRFWQLNLLQGLGKFLFIPEYQDIIFTEGSTNLEVKDRRVEFTDVMLKSDPVQFHGDGWIDFAGNIRFSVNSQFNSDFIRSSPSLKKALTAILTSTEDYLNIRITGTLQNPKYFATPTPINVLEKTRDIIKDGLQSIF